MRALVVQHVAVEGPGLLQDFLRQKGWELDLRCMETPKVTLPKSLSGYQAFIILGGPMGAYEEEFYPYLLQVQRLIREAITADVPTLGICLGAQLIARALGADVGPNPVKEIGWYPLTLTPAGKEAPLFVGLPLELPVFQWHGDTFALPSGAVWLAQSKGCLNQAFVYENSLWALQFHLEVTPAMIANWAELYADELTDFGGPGAAEALVRETQLQWEDQRPRRERFFSNLEMILRG